MQLAHKNHLSHVIRVMGSDVRDFRGPSLQLFVIGGLDKLFQFGHHLVELLDRITPFLGVKVIEGFVVVAAELLFGFPFELGQFLSVPEQEMIGQLADGVVPASVLPTGLLCRQPFTATSIGTNQSFSLWVVRNCSSSTLRSVTGFGFCA